MRYCYTKKLNTELARKQEYIKKYEDRLKPLKEEVKELKRLIDMYDKVYSLIPQINKQPKIK